MASKPGPYTTNKLFHEPASQTLNGANGGHIKRDEIDMDDKVDAHTRATRGFSGGMKRK